MQLTIAIPTYDRNESLCRAFSRLLPQLDAECQVLIVDNHSPLPVADSLRTLLEQSPAPVRLVRNVANIGAAANVLRCMELCETEWLWFVCDDDLVLPNALATVRALIKDHIDAFMINAASPFCPRDHTMRVMSAETFASGLDNVGNFAFLSVNIYNAPVMKAYLRFGYAYSHGAFPQVAMSLMALRDHRVCVLSHAQIVQEVTAPQWPMLEAALGLPILLDLPISGQARSKLARLLPLPLHRFENLVTQLVLDASRGDVDSAVYYFDQVCARLHYFTRSPVLRLKQLLYRPLVRYPRIGRRIVRELLAWTKGRAAADADVLSRESVDRFGRM